MKLRDHLKGKFMAEFEFSSYDKRVSQADGSEIVLFHLSKPLKHVIGSQTLTDDATDETVRMQAWDVTEVFIHERDMGDDDGIDVNDDGSGIVKSNLMLDVTNRNEVWLRRESLAAFGAGRRRERRSERRSGLIGKMNEMKTRSIYGNKNVDPEGKPVDEVKNGIPDVVASEIPPPTIKEKGEIDPVKAAEEQAKVEKELKAKNQPVK